jgi:hypothetical protein
MSNRVVTPSYSVHLGTQLGERKKNLSHFEEATITLRVNGPSEASIVVPTVVKNTRFPYDLLIEDAWLEFWRGVNDSPKSLLGDSPFLLQEYSLFYDKGGAEKFSIDASSGAVIAEWPVVAYAAGSAQADKADFADDMILEIARENLGADATDTDRDMSDYLEIPANAGAGASVAKAFARRKLSRVFTELCQLSAQNGTNLYWDIILKNPANFNSRKFQLVVYPGQRGTYRGFDTANPLIFSPKKGNLENVRYTKSFRETVNYGYGLGNDTEANRAVEPASDAARVAQSIWGRIKEGTRNVNSKDTDVVRGAAEELLWEKRVRESFSADIVSVPGRTFGVDWFCGDIVGVEAFGKRFEAMITPVQITYKAGKETVKAGIRVEL